MKKIIQLKTAALFICIVQLSSCYCYEYSKGRSSVRHLTVVRSVILCPPFPCNGGVEGISVMGTLYNGQIHNFLDSGHQIDNPDGTNSAEWYSTSQFGFRIEKYMNPFRLSVPTLGLGIDYSFTKELLQIQHSANGANQMVYPEWNHHRLFLSVNYVTWVKDKFIGYITFRSGIDFSRGGEDAQLFSEKTDHHNTNQFEGRIGYGFYLFPYRKTALNLEAGWGGGAWVKIGLSRFLF